MSENHRKSLKNTILSKIEQHLVKLSTWDYIFGHFVVFFFVPNNAPRDPPPGIRPRGPAPRGPGPAPQGPGDPLFLLVIVSGSFCSFLLLQLYASVLFWCWICMLLHPPFNIFRPFIRPLGQGISALKWSTLDSYTSTDSIGDLKMLIRQKHFVFTLVYRSATPAGAFLKSNFHIVWTILIDC